MKHRSKKAAFNFGIDANRMLLRKFTVNFLKYGKLKTTITKAKAFKPFIESLLEKAKSESTQNKTYLMSIVNDTAIVKMIYTEVAPVIKDKVGGYVRLIKLQQRENDGAQMVEVNWAYPVVVNKKEEVVTDKIDKKQKKEQEQLPVKKETK